MFIEMSGLSRDQKRRKKLADRQRRRKQRSQKPAGVFPNNSLPGRKTVPLVLIHDIMVAERKTAVEILKEGKTSEKLQELGENALGFAEITTAKFLSKLPPEKPIACKEGCSWCCTLAVDVTAVEVLRIARHLRDTLTPEAIVEFLEQVTRTLIERQAGKRPYCPLLKDNRCSVYHMRPIPCQGWNSFAGERPGEVFRPTANDGQHRHGM